MRWSYFSFLAPLTSLSRIDNINHNFRLWNQDKLEIVSFTYYSVKNPEGHVRILVKGKECRDCKFWLACMLYLDGFHYFFFQQGQNARMAGYCAGFSNYCRFRDLENNYHEYEVS